MSVRFYTNKLHDMVEEGLLSKDDVINACLSYMSEAEVEDLMRSNDLILEQEDDED